jgi:hypothetical protein
VIPAHTDRRRRSLDLRTSASALVQYSVAYGVGLPVFVLYRIGRRLRSRGEPSVPPRQP